MKSQWKIKYSSWRFSWYNNFLLVFRISLSYSYSIDLVWINTVGVSKWKLNEDWQQKNLSLSPLLDIPGRFWKFLDIPSHSTKRIWPGLSILGYWMEILYDLSPGTCSEVFIFQSLCLFSLVNSKYWWEAKTSCTGMTVRYLLGISRKGRPRGRVIDKLLLKCSKKINFDLFL